MLSIAGKDDVVGASAVVGADLNLNMAPVPCRSPMVPSSVLSVLNVNEMNKRNVNRDVMEEPYWSRKGFGMKGVLWIISTWALCESISRRGNAPLEGRNQETHLNFRCTCSPIDLQPYYFDEILDSPQAQCRHICMISLGCVF